MNNELNLGAIKATPKSGTELLTFNEKSTGYSLHNFWQWSASDILSNAMRGIFAEFVVGTAVEMDTKRVRDEWDAYDIKTNSGIKLEIKAAAYIQSWNQKNFSKISFSIKKAKYWDPNNGMSSDEARRYADVYVFCLLKTKNQNIIDPLKLEQWEFYVLPTYKLDNYPRSQTSITLNSLQKLTAAVNYNELRKKIENCYNEQCGYK
ncbi:MAG: hypothetical protein LC128_12435 [Chitinophagales bacterium]|nr:hypothetical protein [Chitinophagales bacterium]